VPKAVGLAEQVLNAYKNKVESFELIPSGGGVFEVTLDGELIFSKKAEARFPDFEEIDARLQRSA
jgi:selenoprotein W-related protein